MDSGAQQPDCLSNLPNVLLALIISSLSFKECVRTNVLSKRWRYVCCETRNISFKESEHVMNHLVFDDRSRILAKSAFVKYVCEWVSGIHDQVIESFEFCLSNPVAFLPQINPFVVSRKVKNLVLDFSNPAWRTYHCVSYRDILVELPEIFYTLTSLESLKVCACEKFDPSRFANTGRLRSLSIGWMSLTNVESLISKSHMLDSLSINDCWGLDVWTIAGDMREFVCENCDFPFIQCSFDLPKVEIFKYSGDIVCLHFERMNKIIKEVYLDFGFLDEPTKSSIAEGGMICDLLNDLRSNRTLTVCPYLLQVIQESIHPIHFLRLVETQNLVLKTKLHPKEFNGIRILLNNCPNLETLTFEMLPPSSIATASSYGGIDPQTYWLKNITYKCLRKTLKVVVVRNFVGGPNELNVLKYLIRSGRGSGPGPVLKRVELYVPKGLDESRKMFAYAGAEMLQRTWKHVQVSCAQLLER